MRLLPRALFADTPEGRRRSQRLRRASTSSGGASSGGAKGGSVSSSSSSSSGKSSSGSSSSSSSSSSSGKSGSSSSGSTGSSGSSSSSSGTKGVTGGGSGVKIGSKSSISSSSLSSTQYAQVYAPRTLSSYGYYRPYAGGFYPVFGFWPIWWYTDAYEGYSNNDTRPGGTLLAAAVTPQVPDPSSNTSSPLYVIYGDTASVQSLLPTLLSQCAGNNATAPTDLSTNQTVQYYRDDSFALYLFPGNVSASSVNSTFEGCLNQTIGDNLPVISGAERVAMTPMGMGTGLVALIVLALSFVM